VKDIESIGQFETRKRDHIRVAMDPGVQSLGSGFDRYSFVHEALPDLDFEEVQIATAIFENSRTPISLKSPFFVSSMTAGHGDSFSINERLAKVASLNGWAMGVGSQRRELFDPAAADEWKRIRALSPDVIFFGNIGVSQLIHTDIDVVKRLSDSLEARAMIVHLNPLQEVLQAEGTPRFRGGLQAIERLARNLEIPVIVKETGCGISATTARRLIEAGAAVIDVAGRGGTHWGRIEGVRAGKSAPVLERAAFTLRDWGLSTTESLEQVVRACEGGATAVWASGGIRSGLEAAIALHMGAEMAGVAQPLMAAALESEDALHFVMKRFEYELKSILFCTGVRDLKEFKSRAVLRKGGEL